MVAPPGGRGGVGGNSHAPPGMLAAGRGSGREMGHGPMDRMDRPERMMPGRGQLGGRGVGDPSLGGRPGGAYGRGGRGSGGGGGGGGVGEYRPGDGSARQEFPPVGREGTGGKYGLVGEACVRVCVLGGMMAHAQVVCRTRFVDPRSLEAVSWLDLTARYISGGERCHVT